MKKILVVLLLALALPAPAAAKELSKLDVCGPSGCNSTSDRALLGRIGVGSDGSIPADPPALAPYYTLVYHVRAGRGESFNGDRKSTRLNSSHVKISYAVFCLKKKNKK